MMTKQINDGITREQFNLSMLKFTGKDLSDRQLNIMFDLWETDYNRKATLTLLDISDMLDATYK